MISTRVIEMDRRLSLVVAVCLVGFCSGLDFTLSHDTTVAEGVGTKRRALCGVLTCVQEHMNASVSHSADKDEIGPAVSMDIISSMSVFKATSSSTGSRASSNNKREILVSSVTSQTPTVTRVANGIKVDGFLEAGRATLRVELTKRADCQSEFTCQVRGLDTQGREAVNTVTLLRDQDPTGNQMDDGSKMPDTTLQLVSLIQQLISTSVSGLEDKIKTMEHELENKIECLGDNVRQLQMDLNNRIDSFEHRNQDRLLLLENRIEDKIGHTVLSLGHGIEDTINDSNSKLNVTVSTKLTQLHHEAKADTLDNVDTLRQEMQSAQEQILRNVSNSIEKTVNRASSDLISCIENNFDVLKSQCQMNMMTMKSEIKALHEEVLSKDNLSLQIWNEMLSSNRDLLVSFGDLESEIYNHTAEARSELRALLLESTLSESTDLKLILTDILTPKFCRKGMGFTLIHSPSPYIVIDPAQRAAGTLHFPHLCDTITDGGGWIVVQRRSTGNTDFNRGWADYKTGFGSYDDDFWLGNDKLHAITSSGGVYEMRVELVYNGKSAYAHYGDFSVAAESDKYRLLAVGAYDGTAGDAMTYHKGRPFTTMDRDNDDRSDNCATFNGGGWWFGNCDDANLNGNWGAGGNLGVDWHQLAGGNSVSYSEMKIRRV